MKVSVGDIRLYFDVEGSQLVSNGDQWREKPTLILLHGGPGGDHSMFKPAFSQLSDIVQIVYLDLRGNGRSDRGAPSAWNLNQWADDIVVFCEALGIHQPIVLGQSFGGFVAINYAIRHPHHANKLILSSTSARFSLQRKVAGFKRRGGAQAAAAAEQYWGQDGARFKSLYDRVCRPLYHTTPLAGSRPPTLHYADVLHHFNNGEYRSYDLRQQMAKIPCPTLIIVGSEDPNTPVEDAEEMAASLTEAAVTYVRLVGAGHGSWHDRPDAFFQAMRSFICAEPPSHCTTTVDGAHARAQNRDGGHDKRQHRDAT